MAHPRRGSDTPRTWPDALSRFPPLPGTYPFQRGPREFEVRVERGSPLGVGHVQQPLHGSTTDENPACSAGERTLVQSVEDFEAGSAEEFDHRQVEDQATRLL